MLKAFVQGNEKIGYWLEFGTDIPILTHSGESEFHAVFSNADETIREEVHAFRGQRIEEKEGQIILEGEVPLSQLNAMVSVRIVYHQINDCVIAKTVELVADRELKFSLVNRLQAKHSPDRYWTFQDNDAEGGAVYELYPAVGMVLGGKSYGLLTDNGYRNRWTRISRRKDGEGYLVGLEYQPDAELTSISNRVEREAGEHYVQYKFGEVIDFTNSSSSIVLVPDRSTWHTITSAERKGIEIPLELDKNEMYEITFSYRSSHKLELSLLDADSASYFEWSYEYGASRDNLPPTEGDEVNTFTRRFFSSRFKRNRQPLLLKIRNDVNDAGELDFEVIGLQIHKHEGTVRQFHTVNPSSPASLRLFLFESDASSHREIQIAAQVRIAEGLGFQGTDTEKMMYADNQMLIWIAQHDKLVPHLVPSLNYHPDMYLRDAFWHAAAIDDKEVSEQCWLRYAETQHEDGQLDTLVMPYYYRPSSDDNDSTMFFLMWACMNHRKYGTQIDRNVIEKAFHSIIRNHSPKRDGLYWSRTAGWLDTIWAVNKIRSINQGHYVVTLQCAKELGLDVSQDEIDKAKNGYRGLYDHQRQSLKWSEDEDYISPSVLLGEFLNLWLFNEPILSSEEVINTVERFPVIIHGVPCICDADGKFFTEANKPWEGKYNWRNGVYHNGGSWFLYEYLAYAAAARHGWAKGKDKMDWRVEMEFSRENEPYSHEFIPLSDDHDDWWPSAGLFAWNTFMIVANKVAVGVV